MIDVLPDRGHFSLSIFWKRCERFGRDRIHFGNDPASVRLDHLRPIAEAAGCEAINGSSHRPLEVVTIGGFAQNRCADASLKVLVPQPIKPVLAQQPRRESQLLTDDKKARICPRSWVQSGVRPTLSD